MKYNIEHLDQYEDLICGPIQSDEALFLYSLIKVMRPRVVVEFGFSEGYSARNFLKALPENSKLYSFDINTYSERLSRSIDDHRLTFIKKNQENFESADIDNNLIDLVFIDSSHELTNYSILFSKIYKHLNKNALIIIHNTGAFNFKDRSIEYRDQIINSCVDARAGGYFIDSHVYITHPDDREFVNYLKRCFPAFKQIHFHSENTIRKGLTILQRNQYLSVNKVGLLRHYKIILLLKYPRIVEFLIKLKNLWRSNNGV